MSVIEQNQPSFGWERPGVLSTSGGPRSTSATIWTVNPAFLQEIKDSNLDLWSLIRELRQTCGLDDTEPIAITRRLVRLLDDLRDGLALQFSLEEAYGYLQLPELPFSSDGIEVCRMAAQARGQHSTLYLRLSDLAERAEELQFRGVTWDDLCKLIQETREFDEKLTQHELIEDELVDRCYDAFVR